jgi:hypothetical protein
LAQKALDSREFDLAARGICNVGACQLVHRQYRAARLSYLEARRVAGLAGDASIQAIAEINLGSIYVEMGDLDTAFNGPNAVSIT